MRDHHRGNAAVGGKTLFEPGDCLQENQLGNGRGKQVWKIRRNLDAAEVAHESGGHVDTLRPIFFSIKQAVVGPQRTAEEPYPVVNVRRAFEHVDRCALGQAVQLLVGRDQVAAVEFVIAGHVQHRCRACPGPLDGRGRPGDVSGQDHDVGFNRRERQGLDGQMDIGKQGDAHGRFLTVSVFT
ncbi:hypothetical protein D3C84_685080 [compost metagenome]